VDRPPLLTGAEALAVSFAAGPAATIVSAYVLDRLGAPFPPLLLLAIFVAATLVTFWTLLPHLEWRAEELTVFLAIVFTIFGWLLWIAAPALLPLGSGSDLTHHLLLIQYIEAHWRFVHDPAAERFLGEMASYTPGSHLLAAAAGAWTGTSGLRALHSVLAWTVALKAGFVFLIARRTIAAVMRASTPGTRVAPLALASIAVVLLFASKVYFLRSFIENSFIAQVAGELFAVVMWWSLVVWNAGAMSAVVFGTAGVAAFLTWPVWTGPPVVVAGMLALADRERSFNERARHLALAGAPLALVGALYFAARPGGVAMAGTSGAAPWPQVSSYGLWFLALSAIGLVIAAARRDSSIVTLFAAAILLQSAALYLVAGGPGTESPYLSLKMFYLLLYPQSVAAAIALAEFCRVVAAVSPLRWRQPAVAGLAVVLAIAVAIPIGRTLRRAPRSLTILKHPSISEPLERAGLWARDHVPPSCVEYLVDLDETAYWLHLAVLGNPRLTPRSLDPDTYEPDLAVARWLTPGGLEYGIADFSTLARGVREELDVLQQFDTAAVVKRRGPSSCPSEQ
jgi:hypothetical protein